MLASTKLLIWALTGVMAVLTVFFNLHIIVSNWWRYRERSKWTPGDTIVTALSTSSGVHQLLCYFWMTMDEVDRECRLARLPYSVLLLLIFSLKFTIMWNTGFLTSHYSNKLTIAPKRCSTNLHAAIIKHVTAVVFLIPLLSLAASAPMLVVLHPDNRTRAGEDCGVMIPDTVLGRAYEAVYLLLADVLPGAVMVKCCVSIAVQLGVHLHSVKTSTNGAHRPKSGSQVRVIVMTLSLVAVFLCFLVVDLYVHCMIAVRHQNTLVLTLFFTSLYTAVTAVVLIWGKRSMWRSLVGAFHGCCEWRRLFLPKVPEPDSKPASAPQNKS